MSEDMREIGERIKSRMPEGMTQQSLAEAMEMTPDALSRMLNGKRGITMTELGKAAEVLGASAHWLVTGHKDPYAMRFAARHTYDFDTHRHINEGREKDREVLDHIAEVYRAAHGSLRASSVVLPKTAKQMREALGDGFVNDFAARVKEVLDVDVMKRSGLSTDYSLCIVGRRVVVLNKQFWARTNWSLAHELGHLVQGHLDRDGDIAGEADEKQANAFAAELLLPEKWMRNFNWPALTRADVARMVWEAKVSAAAMRVRIETLRLKASDEVREALELTTPKLLTLARTSAAERYRDVFVPDWSPTVIAALLEETEKGNADPMLTSRVLGVPVDDIDFPEPPSEEEMVERYERTMLGRRRHDDGAGESAL